MLIDGSVSVEPELLADAIPTALDKRRKKLPSRVFSVERENGTIHFYYIHGLVLARFLIAIGQCQPSALGAVALRNS